MGDRGACGMTEPVWQYDRNSISQKDTCALAFQCHPGDPCQLHARPIPSRIPACSAQTNRYRLIRPQDCFGSGSRCVRQEIESTVKDTHQELRNTLNFRMISANRGYPRSSAPLSANRSRRGGGDLACAISSGGCEISAGYSKDGHRTTSSRKTSMRNGKPEAWISRSIAPPLPRHRTRP